MKKTVLVTGGAGFIGSHVVDALLARGDDVHVLDDLSKGRAQQVPGPAPLYVLDIADAPLAKLFSGVQFDAVVHCAAQTNVMVSLADPRLDYRINVVGAERIVTAAERSGVERFVFISSGGAIYGETREPATEETAPRPENPYGEHKLEGEDVVARSPMSTVSLRLSNVYGPRQRSDAEGGVVSVFGERLVARLPPRIYGDGGQQRDFVHVDDVASAIALALDDESMTGVWNVASGASTSVNELAALMMSVAGSDVGIEHAPARGEVRRSAMDVSKLMATGRWRPRVGLREGVSSVILGVATRVTTEAPAEQRVEDGR